MAQHCGAFGMKATPPTLDSVPGPTRLAPEGDARQLRQLATPFLGLVPNMAWAGNTK